MIRKSGYRLSEKTGCAACRFFAGAPAVLERAVPGLNILSSAYGSVRGDTGLCERHGVFTAARSPACPQFEKAVADRERAGN